MSPGLRILVLSAVINMPGGRPLFASPPERGEVKVVVAGIDRSFAAIAKSLTESLSFIAVTAQFERAVSVDPRSVSEIHPPRQSLFAHLWIDATADNQITLYITDAATERVFVRRMNLDRGLDTVAVEGLAFVAQNSLEALLAGKVIGMTRSDYERSLEVAAPRPPPKREPETVGAHPNDAGLHNARPSNWRLSVGYELQGWDSATVRHEAAFGVELERWALRFGMDLFGTWPIHFQNRESGAEVSSYGARLVVSRPLALSPRLRLVPGIGFAVELSRIRPELSSPEAQTVSPYFAIDPTMRAVLGIERSLSRWSLRGILGVDFEPRPVQYVITRQAATEVVRTPWRERPFAAIVLATRL